MSTIIALALGSNVGDREYLLRSAINRLKQHVTVVRTSDFIRSAPVDSPRGAGEYLNAALTGFTRLPARELLAFTQEVERSLGRRSKGGNRPRTIDIDVIFYGALRVRSRDLEIPHRRYSQRDFVIGPLRSIEAPWLEAG